MLSQWMPLREGMELHHSRGIAALRGTPAVGKFLFLHPSLGDCVPCCGRNHNVYASTTGPYAPHYLSERVLSVLGVRQSRRGEGPRRPAGEEPGGDRSEGPK